MWLFRYGMYHVKSTVMNNISSIALPVTVIQVGDNFTSVDVAVADWLVPVTSSRSRPAHWSVRVTSEDVRPAGWLVPMTSFYVHVS